MKNKSTITAGDELYRTDDLEIEFERGKVEGIKEMEEKYKFVPTTSDCDSCPKLWPIQDENEKFKYEIEKLNDDSNREMEFERGKAEGIKETEEKYKNHHTPVDFRTSCHEAELRGREQAVKEYMDNIRLIHGYTPDELQFKKEEARQEGIRIGREQEQIEFDNKCEHCLNEHCNKLHQLQDALEEAQRYRENSTVIESNRRDEFEAGRQQQHKEMLAILQAVKVKY